LHVQLHAIDIAAVEDSVSPFHTERAGNPPYSEWWSVR